jgi:exosortase
MGPRAEWDWNRVLTPQVVLLILPAVIGVVAAYSYPFYVWERVWRNNSAWNHGYLIPLIAIVIAHFRLKECVPRRIEPCFWGLPLILLGCVIRIWARMLKFGYPGDATFLLVVGGVVLLVLGWDMMKALWIAILFLGLMIPWDTKYYEQVALPLQTLAAVVGERLLTLGGMMVMRQGNVMYLPSGPLTVAEACSGLHLLFAFVALGVMMAYIHVRPTWERVVIMASSVPIAVLCNVIRVTLMAIASDGLFFEMQRAMEGAATWSASLPGFILGMLKGDTLAERLADLREGVLNPESLLHQSFGFAMLGLAFLLMHLLLRGIDAMFTEEPDETPAPGKPAAPPAP